MDGFIRKHVPEADMLPDLPIPSAVGAVEVAVDHPLTRDERILLVLDKVVAGRSIRSANLCHASVPQLSKSQSAS